MFNVLPSVKSPVLLDISHNKKNHHRKEGSISQGILLLIGPTTEHEIK
jgi:hypothetical protein